MKNTKELNKINYLYIYQVVYLDSNNTYHEVEIEANSYREAQNRCFEQYKEAKRVWVSDERERDKQKNC